ncbi:unnamed protein product, partial [Polarella glacialis]
VWASGLADIHSVAEAENVSTARIRLRDGQEMPALGLGTWKAPPNVVGDAVFAALSAGYRHIDAAHIYLNSVEVGAGLQRAVDAGLVTRSEVWVTSKLWMTDFAPSRVGPAVDTLLRDLGLDYLDQVLLHWPVALKAPPAECPPTCPEEFAGTDNVLRPRGADGHMVQSLTPIVETWRSLQVAAAGGRIRSLGVSNFSPEELEPLLAEKVPPAVNQVECHPNWNQKELREWMASRNVVLVSYSPLGNPAIYETTALRAPEVIRVAAAVGRTPAQVLLRWSHQLGNVVIPKSASVHRISENADIFSFSLDEGQMLTLSSMEQRRLANPPIRAGGRRAFDEL